MASEVKRLVDMSRIIDQAAMPEKPKEKKVIVLSISRYVVSYDLWIGVIAVAVLPEKAFCSAVTTQLTRFDIDLGPWDYTKL